MTGIAAVGVNNNLASRKAAVTVRTSDNKAPCGIDKEFCILVYHFLRKNLIKNVLFNILMNLLLSYVLIVLCGKYHCVQARCV